MKSNMQCEGTPMQVDDTINELELAIKLASIEMSNEESQQ